MKRIFFKIYFVLNRIKLFFLFNLDHKVYMKNYIHFLKKIGVKINGTPRFIHYNVKFDATDKYSLIELNHNCVVTGSTLILTHDFSIYHASIGVGKSKYSDREFARKGRVIIGKNAFVGGNCIILPNTHIGENSIVAAGSVITKDVLPNTIVGGNPAREINSISNYVDKFNKNYNK